MERIIAYTMSVKFTKDEMNNMEKMLKTFLVNNNITLQPPVDIFKIATELGFDIRGAEFRDDLDGLLLVDERKTFIEPFSTNKVIAYNCKKTLDHKKFIVGHELAHYIDEKHSNPNSEIVCAARDHTEPYSNDRKEQMKDYLSAAILMPIDSMKKKYNNVSDKKSSDFYNRVAEEFNVSVVMAKRRIEEIFYE